MRAKSLTFAYPPVEYWSTVDIGVSSPPFIVPFFAPLHRIRRELNPCLVSDISKSLAGETLWKKQKSSTPTPCPTDGKLLDKGLVM